MKLATLLLATTFCASLWAQPKPVDENGVLTPEGAAVMQKALVPAMQSIMGTAEVDPGLLEQVVQTGYFRYAGKWTLFVNPIFGEVFLLGPAGSAWQPLSLTGIAMYMLDEERKKTNDVEGIFAQHERGLNALIDKEDHQPGTIDGLFQAAERVKKTPGYDAGLEGKLFSLISERTRNAMAVSCTRNLDKEKAAALIVSAAKAQGIALPEGVLFVDLYPLDKNSATATAMDPTRQLYAFMPVEVNFKNSTPCALRETGVRLFKIKGPQE